MPRILTIVAAFVLGAALCFALVHRRVRDMPREQAMVELLHTKAAVERALRHRESTLRRQLEAFAQLVSGDRDFAMKLIVEQDRSAPEVSDLASVYMPAMALSLLEIADSAGSLLSSGHFPASAGNSVSDKLALLDTTARCVDDLVRGQPALTIQAKVATMLGDAARVSCSGGWLIDQAFLEDLTPHPGVTLLLRHGDSFLGMDSVTSVSAIVDNVMIVNDTRYLATSLRLGYRGDGVEPELFILTTLPGSVSLF